MGSSFPSDIQTQPIQRIVCRFICVASDDCPVTLANLLGWQLNVATTTTSTTAVATSAAIRITRVKMWGINDSTNANVNETISLTWVGSGGLGLSRSITSSGSDAVPAHISTVPPVDSECGWWHNYDADPGTVLFYVTNPTPGAILDIHLDYIASGQAAQGTSVPLASTTAVYVIPAKQIGVYRSVLFSNGLGGTTVFQPVGLAFVAPSAVTFV